MASSCKKGFYANERFIILQDADYWTSKFIHCVGLEYISEVFLGTQVLEDLRLLKDCKPASVSDWSFDENCHFCCLRREKVKGHVVALKKQIVESGGKPLLGEDPSNISRLEWQSEEFLNALLHRKEYTPRIPDPHIPVVACEIVQQMINHLGTYYYASRINSSQSNDEKDKSLLTSSRVMPTTAAAPQNLVNNKFVMADQDAPLDLSVRKVKVENIDQDVVLDLSTKKFFNKGHACPRNSYTQVRPDSRLIKRDSVELSLSRVQDVQSASTLEEFMSKLCLHHQCQIVDALGFLQTEVKTVAGSSYSQTPAPTFSEKQATASCSRVSFEARSEIRWSERTCSVDAATAQEPSVVVSKVAPEKPVDLCKMGIGGLLSSSCEVSNECENSSTLKSQSLFIINNISDHPGAKQPSDFCFQQVGTDGVKTCPYNVERHLPTCTAESDRADLYPECIEKRSPVRNKDAVSKTSTVQRTSNVVLQISPRTARKGRKGSVPLQRNGSSSYIINDPDSHCDLVYVSKSVTECQPQSRNRLHPRHNARKSTRGHRYVEEYLELKTVRTLARKSVSAVSGNCPTRMPDVHTSVTPKQSFTKPDSVPLMNTPFAGDCVKDDQKSSEQFMDDEMPGNVGKVTSQGLILETSQTGKNESSAQIPNKLACNERELSTQQDVIINAVSCAPNTAKTQTDNDMVVTETSETVNLIVQKDVCDFQTSPVTTKTICGLVSKCQDESIKPSLSAASPNMTNVETPDAFIVEPRNDLTKIKLTPVQIDTVELTTENEVNKSAQGQVSPDIEMNHEMSSCIKVPEKNEGDSGVTILNEVSTVHSPVKPKENVDLALHTENDSSEKKGFGKQAPPSDRCLRSRGSKGTMDATKDSKCGAELVDLNITHANGQSPDTLLVKRPLNSIETNVCFEGEHDLKASDILKAGDQPTLTDHHTFRTPTSATAVEQDEPQSPDLQKKGEKSPGVEVLSEILNITSTTKNGKPHKLNKQNSEKMPLRNRSQKLETGLHVHSVNSLPIRKSSPSSKSMLLRSRNNIEQLVSSQSSNLIPGAHLEKPELTPSISGNCVTEQVTKRDLVSLSPTSLVRRPVKSKSSSAIKQSRGLLVRRSVKCSSSGFICEQPVSSHSRATCSKSESGGHMPLRSGTSSTAEQLPTNKPAVEDALVSPGRMSLRRGSLSSEKPCGSATPRGRNKCSQRLQQALFSSGVEASALSSKVKIEKNTETQTIDSFNLSHEFLHTAGLQKTEPDICSPPKFLEVLRGEKHEQLVSHLNTKFDKMHKGWIQMDKEAQPAPKPKNKADRLKEIWKSKRRIRKSRPLEQQKFSPVQMLFMKPFDLPSICRWFLQSTETRSLVIVKKVNTRLPSETQLCFHTSAAGTGSSHGIFPSLQAERLKKHLKKFAIASPVKNNLKNQRLISKALGQDIFAFRTKEKPEPKTATRICTKAQSLAGLTPTQAPDNLCTITGSSKNPASARIIKKYSNMREKLQVQQSKKCEEKTLRVTRLKTSLITKKPAEQKLAARKGSKSTVVQSVKSLTKKAKTKSAVTRQTLKKPLGHKDGTLPKRLQALTKVTKANVEHASSKREMIRPRADKAHQTKANGAKVERKKSVLNKYPNSLEPQSLDMDVKPLSLEDQVLTRSQRKLEFTHIGSPKCSTKRGSEQLVNPIKRTRTSKS